MAAEQRRKAWGRIAELDGIRGIAILAVLFYHLFSYTMFRESWTGAARLIFKATEHWSHGVDLFFVLSGFLITGILLDTRGDQRYFRNFYARRALRILPLYYAVLLTILLCYRGRETYVALSFFHLSNLAPIFGITMANGAMWSLSVEEHFYLGWPLVVHRFGAATAARAAAAVCLAEPVIRALAFRHVATVFPYTWFRLDGIASGALIACYVRSAGYTRRGARRAALLLAGAGCLLEAVGTPWGIRDTQTLCGATLKFTAIDLICAAIVLWGVSESGTRATAVLRVRVLRVCGDLSYCLYLSHCMVMDAYDGMLRRLDRPPATTSFEGVLLRAAAVLAGSFLIAAISRRAIERPALAAKRYFEPQLERGEAQAAPAVIGR